MATAYAAPRRKNSTLIASALVTLGATYALSAAAVLRGGEPGIRTGIAALPGDGSVWVFLAAFASATLLLLFLLRTVRGARLFEAVFVLAVFTGIASLAAALFGVSWAVLLTAACVFLYYASRSVLAFDLLLIAGGAGIAANLGGAMTPVGVAIVLLLLSAYDIVAVYATKHMVAMAEALLRRRVFFAMILPERPSGYLLPVTEAAPGNGFLFLGTGDVVLPAMLVASVASVAGPRAALFTAAGALIGTAVLQVLFARQGNGRPMPALPPIASGAILGALASQFI